MTFQQGDLSPPRRPGRPRRWLAAVTAAALGAGLAISAAGAPAQADPPKPAGGPAKQAPGITAKVDKSTVEPGRRDAMLPRGWRTSADRAWTTAGDATGFHLLLADARSGYTWRTAATLREPGLETDQWIGNVCFTGSGRRAVVVYAPRVFTNRAQLFDRGGFAAVVDLASGAVRKLATRVSLAYYNPGCGAGETAVLTQSGAVAFGKTRLHVLDTARGTLIRRHELARQVTSAVPSGNRVVAAAGAKLIEVSPSGTARRLAATRGVPFELHPDAAGGITFLEQHGEATAVAKRFAAGSSQELASGPLTEVGLDAGAGGRVFLTGKPTMVRPLPRGVTRVDAPHEAELSSLGQLAVTRAAPDPARSRAAQPARPADPDRASPVAIRARVVVTGKDLDFQARPGLRAPALIGQGARPSAAAAGRPAGKRALAAGSPTDPVDADRTCAVPRNDPRAMVYQPHWKQVEWAANLAVQGALNIQRPANWKGSGLPAWSPQGMFPWRELAGGGRVPAQVLLGILAQESNLWQASYHAVTTGGGNPLVGSFYGANVYNDDPLDDWVIRWDKADCGYGVAQVTDGMRLADGGRTPEEKRAIALDYATNIAAGLQILREKWDQTYRMNLRVNNADPARIENWFFAAWAYNSGINPQASTGNTSGCTPGPNCTDADGNWGLGWTNNPANSDYPRNRKPFLEYTQDDARTPQKWPYPEKIIGWAAHPIVKYILRTGDYQAGYNQAWWTTDLNRQAAKPPIGAFCSAGNHCDLNRSGEACARADFHCWWNRPVTWKPDCATSCGHENIRFDPGLPEPAIAVADENYRPNCDPNDPSNRAPVGALIVDDVPNSAPTQRRECPHLWTNNGTFSLRFAEGMAAGRYPSKMDFHQIAGGFNGHFWFSHVRSRGWADHSGTEVTGTWALSRPLYGWARVVVHMPDHGAHTQQARYDVDLGDGSPARRRVVLQRTEAHRWVSLGAFKFNGWPKVSLSNVTGNAGGLELNEDIAWDAIAFQPLAAKPQQVVSLGDSYSSGEGASMDARFDYYAETDDDGGGDPEFRNACHRSKFAWSRKGVLKDSSTPIGARSDGFDPTLDHQLLACSGAETENVLSSDPIPGSGARVENAWRESAVGQYRELSQLDRGFLDENTTLVTMTIGGNDARFGPVLTYCMTGQIGDCQGDRFKGDEEAGIPPDTEILGVAEPEIIRDKVWRSVVIVLGEIHRKAPNATIVVMGYPRLMSNRGSCYAPLLTGDEADWMNSMSDLVAETLQRAVDHVRAEGTQAILADPRQDFQNKGVCASDENIHGIIPDKTQGEDPDAAVSQQSFHPKKNGTTLYANALNRALRANQL